MLAGLAAAIALVSMLARALALDPFHAALLARLDGVRSVVVRLGSLAVRFAMRLLVMSDRFAAGHGEISI